jgi:hypothetical protein
MMSTTLFLFSFFLQLSKMLLASVDLGCSEEVIFVPFVFNFCMLLKCFAQVLTVVAMLSGDGGKVGPLQQASAAIIQPFPGFLPSQGQRNGG